MTNKKTLQFQRDKMLIRSLLAKQIQYLNFQRCLQIRQTPGNKFSFHKGINKKPSILFYSNRLTHNICYGFSKQRIIEQMQKFNQQLDAKHSSMVNTENVKEKENAYLEKQQKIIKDFLDLTQESFSEHLEQQLKEKYHVDAQMLLMIISSLQDPKVIKQTMSKIYPFIPILQPKQLLLLIQLLVAHRPQTLPPLPTLPPKPLQTIQPILLLLNQLYPKQQKLIQWLKQIPLYKGKNICMLAAGFFAIYQKMDPHVRFKNERVISRCVERVVDLVVDEDAQTQVSVAILGLEAEETGQFADKLLIELEKIDYSEVDPLKLQLFFIHLQRSISIRYAQASVQGSKKSKYKILSQSEQGQVISKQQQQYQLPSGQQLQYSQISQIQKFKFLNNIAKTLVTKIIDMNWNQLMKLNLLIQYWRILPMFPNMYPWNSLNTKLVHFTNEKPIIKKMTNLTHQQLLVILEAMDKLKINKSQLLMRLLTLMSDRLGELNGDQLMRLTKVCVTFVRQCEDFLISVRFQIENRKFIFSDKEIDQLNEIFKRVLVLFPRPLVK